MKPNVSSYSTNKYVFNEKEKEKLPRMLLLINKFWKGNRTPVSDDCDVFAKYLCKALKGRIIEAKSGEECLTWIMPKKWTVRRGKLQTKNGEIIADFAYNPLYLWTHSISFKGEITKDELVNDHMCSDSERPDDIIYHYTNGYRRDASEWGFCLPYRVIKNLKDPTYFVDIDTSLQDNGSVKVVDIFLPGKNKDTIAIMAHTCHPAQVSDGIANISVAIELFHYLKSLPKRKYSYRFIFGPEYFAGAVYLAKAPKKEVENIRYGIYLDVLSNHEPIGMQHSWQGNSLIDNIAKNVLSNHAKYFIEKPYRELWGNDELFYNGPGFKIPTIGIGRGMHREYHCSTDTPENIDEYHLIESVWIIKRIIEAIEKDFIPIPKFRGPIYASRYNLINNQKISQSLNKNRDNVQMLIDGKNSCMDIAHLLNIEFFELIDFMKILKKDCLIGFKDYKLNSKNKVSYLDRGCFI